MPNTLQLAMGAGVASLLFALSTFFLFPEGGQAGLGQESSVLFGVVGLIFYLVYIYGFVLLGEKYKTRPIVFASYSIIALSILIALSAGIAPEQEIESISTVVLGLLIAASMIVIGWNVLNLKSAFGTLAVWYGCLEMLSATGILFIFSEFSAYFIDILLFALGSLLLFRASKK